MTLRNTYLTLLLFLLIVVQGIIAQPVIQQIDKHKAGLREVVSIKGSGFGSLSSQVQVWFGGAKVTTILSVTDQLIEVEVPGNAMYDPIYVVRTDTGLSGSAPTSFLYSFGGEQGVATTDFAAQVDFQSESSLNDLCMCDFDSDGNTDIVAASRVTSTSFDFFRNTGTPGTVNFVKTKLNLGARTRHSACGDLNGDGHPDLILSEDGDDIYILKNNAGAAPNFAARSTINFASREPKRIAIADLDLDGKPDLIITDQKVVPGGPATVIVLRNQSTLATISFAPAQFLSVPGAESTDALDVADLDGDGFPDIVTSQFNTTNSNLFVFKNSSSVGAISFNAPMILPIINNVVNVRLGDLDGDHKPDIAATQLLASGFTVFLNQSNGGSFSFAAGEYIVTDAGPAGIDFGDLDGDGKTDVAIASLRTDAIPKSITVLSNTSTLGDISFERTTFPTTFINRNISIGDLDNDGKPDIAFTSVDDNQASIPASKISVLRNRSCLLPSINSESPITICNGFTLELQATQGEGVTYQWYRDGTVLAGETQPLLSVTLEGDYTVTLTGESGACIETSQPVTVNVVTGASIDPVVASNNGPVCLGDDLLLEANAVTGATAYRWSGPGGYESGDITPGQNALVEDFSIAKSGRYELSVFVGTCLAQQTSTVVEPISIPEFSISAGASLLFCDGATKTLTISPSVSNFTYKWFRNGNVLSGATALTFTASESGEYTVEITSSLNSGCQPVETNSINLLELELPVASFTAPGEVCVGQVVEFINTSSPASPASPLFYAWAFGDAGISQDISPEHSYTVEASRIVTLTVSYENGLCADSDSKPILITPAPVIGITQTENRFAFCPGESIELGVSGGPFDSYEWTTQATTPTIAVSQAGIIGVTVTTSTGCTLGTNRNIEAFDEPEVLTTAEPEEISRGTSSQLTATGLDVYQWSPPETLTDPTIANPVASPMESTTYTVTGTDSNGCAGEATVEVRIKGESIVNLLTPSNSFSPNGDGINETWSIENILTFDECGVTVYDEKGAKVFESKPYQNTWNGTVNGKELPQGVYYYVIRCEGQENEPRTGSITLLR